MELAKECKKCLYEKEIKRAENIKNLLERKQYIKEVEYAFCLLYTSDAADE